MTRQTTQASALIDLAALTVLMTAGKAHLYQDDGFVPNENSSLADCNAHEATYTGYVPGGVALAGPLGPYADGPNQYSENFGTVLFQPTGPVLVTNAIRGVYFEDKNGILRDFWIFDAPILMNAVLDAIIIDPKFSTKNPAQAGLPDPV